MYNKNYKLLFNWSITLSCNFNCKYCNNKIIENRTINMLQSTALGTFITNKIWSITTKSKKKANYNIDKIVNFFNSTGKTAKIKLLGGEPFLYPDFIELCIELTKYHFIDIETNLSINQIKKFADTINPERMEDIRASFHIEELEEKNLINRFIDNFLYCKKKGFTITAIVIVYPPIMEKILKYREILLKEGIILYSQPFVGYYKRKEYPSSYTKKEIKDLNIDFTYTSLTRNTKNQSCSAGNSFFVILPSGDIYPCYQLLKKNKNLGNINNGYKVSNKLIRCPYDKCYCDPKSMNKKLFENTILNLNN